MSLVSIDRSPKLLNCYRFLYITLRFPLSFTFSTMPAFVKMSMFLFVVLHVVLHFSAMVFIGRPFLEGVHFKIEIKISD